MTRHYQDNDLLAHALLPDHDAELALHVGACEACGARFRVLNDGLSRLGAAKGEREMPETFWKRQELGVMRTIDERRRRMPGIGARIAAAAAVVLVVAAFWAGRGSVSTVPLTSTMVTATIASTATTAASQTQENVFTGSQVTSDPWQSEQLEDFQTVVAWESWVEADQKNRGTI